MASVRPGYCAQQSYTGEKKHFYLNSLSIKFFEHISITSVFISLAQSVMKILLITLICATMSFYKKRVFTLENWTTASRNNLAFVKLHQFTPHEDLTKKKVSSVFPLQLWNLTTYSPYCQLRHLFQTPHKSMKHIPFLFLLCAQTLSVRNRCVYSNHLVNLWVLL